ncbi:MAG: zf-HC2 domain-containing protein [Acidimicrobiia bacterium]|nr:zf-HC2 domain-containing protein [Acidimicrobiia bacterium]
MTDQPPTDQDLELASAYLDGEATPDERARVEADPQLLARVDELRAVAGAVGTGFTPLTEEQAASQRRRAIAAKPIPTAPPLPARRRTPLPSPLIAAAVVVVIALAGIWLVIAAGNGSSSDKDSSGASTGATTTQRSGGGATSEATTTEVPDLGSFPTRNALTAALQRSDVTTLAATPGTANATAKAARLSIDRCEATIEAGQPELGERLAVATARLDGSAVYVFSHPVRDKQPPVTQLTVADQQTCRVLFAIQR